MSKAHDGPGYRFATPSVYVPVPTRHCPSTDAVIGLLQAIRKWLELSLNVCGG